MQIALVFSTLASLATAASNNWSTQRIGKALLTGIALSSVGAQQSHGTVYDNTLGDLESYLNETDTAPIIREFFYRNTQMGLVDPYQAKDTVASESSLLADADSQQNYGFPRQEYLVAITDQYLLGTKQLVDEMDRLGLPVPNRHRVLKQYNERESRYLYIRDFREFSTRETACPGLLSEIDSYSKWIKKVDSIITDRMLSKRTESGNAGQLLDLLRFLLASMRRWCQ